MVGGNFVPTSEVDLTPHEREQSAGPGTGTEVGLGLNDYLRSILPNRIIRGKLKQYLLKS